ncbi:hypothetical protein CA604_00535 [Taylorella equigenitalis]|nr:hypothetical protein CA604_00535 [Taylorella equigenitalis]
MIYDEENLVKYKFYNDGKIWKLKIKEKPSLMPIFEDSTIHRNGLFPTKWMIFCCEKTELKK